MCVCVLTACFPEVDKRMFSCKSDIHLQFYFTSAPWCLVIYLKGSDFYDNVGGESQWSTWVEVFNNIITLFLLHSRAVNWWLRARQKTQYLHFSFSTVTISGKSDNHQQHFLIWCLALLYPHLSLSKMKKTNKKKTLNVGLWYFLEWN